MTSTRTIAFLSARLVPWCRFGRARAGFTLLELLVTIGIIALLAAIVLAVSASVLRNSERKQLEMAFQALDQAVAEFERARGQKITYRRLNGDPVGDYDIVELDIGGAYLIVCLLNGMDIDGTGNNHQFRPLLASHEPSMEILKRISPDLLRRDPSTAPGYPGGPVPSLAFVPDPRVPGTTPNAAIARLELIDPWGNRIGVVFPGRPAVPGEGRDPDGTVRTGDEQILGVCRDRRICFVSAGPDGNFGTRDDNVYSYELIWPVPPLQ